jgi:hypothetical protein
VPDIAGVPGWLLAYSLPAIMLLLILALTIESFRGKSTFKLVHFFTDSQGRGSKYAFAYMIILIVGAWGLWVMILMNVLQEWYWTTFLGVFLLGALAGTAAAVKQAISAPDQVPPADAGDKP